MPGRFLQVPGGPVGYEAFYPGTLSPNQKEQSTLWTDRWNYEGRNQKLLATFGFTFDMNDAWWPACSGGMDDPADPSGRCWLVQGNQGQSNMNAGPFEPWNYGLGGSRSSKYIMGQCKDSLGNVLGGAVVQCFRTSDDLFIGEIGADDKGYFEIPCPNTPTDQHYLVGYYASGLLAGTTVNTIVPKWRDGTV
jgi:hypothetical protein